MVTGASGSLNLLIDDVIIAWLKRQFWNQTFASGPTDHEDRWGLTLSRLLISG